MVSPGVGYLRVIDFNKSTPDQIRNEVTTLTKSGATRFVIDLRGAAFGDVENGYAAARLFVTGGTLGFRQERGKNKEAISSAAGDGSINQPIALLTDNGTSGPAELFAAALTGNKRGSLFGERTLGRAARQRQGQRRAGAIPVDQRARIRRQRAPAEPRVERGRAQAHGSLPGQNVHGLARNGVPGQPVAGSHQHAAVIGRPFAARQPGIRRAANLGNALPGHIGGAQAHFAAFLDREEQAAARSGQPLDGGALLAAGLPIGKYDDLTAKEIIAQLGELDEAGLKAVEAFESAHGQRKTVLREIESRLHPEVA